MTPEERDFGARMFGAFSSPARIHILERLADGPASVNEIAQATGLKQSMTSQHLSVLLNAGAVVCSAVGNQRVYRLRGPRIARILQLVQEFYDIHLEALLAGRHAESQVA